MKAYLEQLLGQALEQLRVTGRVPADAVVRVQVQRARQPAHGAFTSAIALQLAEFAGRAPRELAAELVAALPVSEHLQGAEIAGPGYINFYLADTAQTAIVGQVLSAGERWGQHQFGANRMVQLRLVLDAAGGEPSLSDGRVLAVGDVLTALLEACHFRVTSRVDVSADQGSAALQAARQAIARFGVRGGCVIDPAREPAGDSSGQARVIVSCSAVTPAESDELAEHVSVQAVRAGAGMVPAAGEPGGAAAEPTLAQLCDQVGVEAVRYCLLRQPDGQRIEFDAQQAQQQSLENPLYNVQQAHALTGVVQRTLVRRALSFAPAEASAYGHRLTEIVELELLSLLRAWPDVVQLAALDRQPHQVTTYLRDLAYSLHTMYSTHKILVDDAPLRQARVGLTLAVRQVLTNGLYLLGVSTPEVL